MLFSLLLAASSARIARAATAQVFVPPSEGPLVQTPNYTSFSNKTLNDAKNIVKGKAFDRIIQVWLENTDFETASSTPIFESLAEQGILFTNYNSVTHPSEPNYLASCGGDFFGAADDNMYHVPSNITTCVDLLEDKGITWATYQENMPADGFYGFSFSAPNYANDSAPPYPYYMRKHNPPILFDAISQEPARAARIRNFNDFANDVVNGSLPQWIFVTPNMVNDAHDTTIDFAASFLEYWLLPLLTDPRVNTVFNDNEKRDGGKGSSNGSGKSSGGKGGGNDNDDDETGGTLILITFDENENHAIQNRVWTLALGTAVPVSLRGTTDNTFYTHYSGLSTIQSNWGLKTLGRQDANATVSNVFSFVAAKTGYKNVNPTPNQIPQFNLSAVAPGALTSALFVPFSAPNLNAKGAGGQGVLLRPGLNTKLTADKLPAPVNLAALNTTTPWQMSPETASGAHIVACASASCP